MRASSITAIRTSILTVAALIAALHGSHGAATELGEPAPALSVDLSLAGPEPEQLSWQALRGRAVVIEFWATWCFPCVEEIPHWNELVEEFAEEPILFLSVSDETEEKVRPFLEKRPIAGALALDVDRDMFDAYGVGGIPHTVLVDPEGNVQAVTSPHEVKAEHLRALIAGERPELRAHMSFDDIMKQHVGNSEDHAKPLVQAMVRPASSADGSLLAAGHGLYLATHATPGSVIAYAWDTSASQVVMPDPAEADFRYDFIFTGIEDEEAKKAVMRNVIAEALNIETRRERRERDVLVLRRLPGAELRLSPGNEAVPPGTSFEPGSLHFPNSEMAGAAKAFEGLLSMPVLDETGLSGSFELKVEYDPEDPVATLRAALEAQGLTLEESRRELEMLVLEKVESLLEKAGL